MTGHSTGISATKMQEKKLSQELTKVGDDNAQTLTVIWREFVDSTTCTSRHSICLHEASDLYSPYLDDIADELWGLLYLHHLRRFH